ncbi:hypothetical protein NUW58_g1995 [Xylaria curta]|uniref:Uncharacterized protein n=1 Tax=Xylaria curta TaxID=42375 RepID=A0ACC1PHQ6_9PEZI|nr:hypothetical protein NUW58_g1995 [Xylaria curta]
MEELNAGFGKLGLNSGGFEGDGLQNDTQDQIPFQPSGDLAAKLGDSPRYLFRVFSEASAGENTNEWVKSPDAMKGILVDIFARDDPLKTIQLCIVDTTKFPRGVFLRDLDLIEEFEDKGLGNLHTLRRKQHFFYSGVYYFGEYLSQGQTKIRGRSCIVSCDKIVNGNLFTLAPSFRKELAAKPLEWANSVIKFREPFYRFANSSTKVAETAHLTAAITIALGFEPNWILPIFANLLALSPRRAQDQGIIGVVIHGFPSVEKRLLLSQETKVVADHTIPEVLQFVPFQKYAKRREYDPEGRIMVFEGQSVPWKDHLYTLEDEQKTEDQNKVLYVLYPEKPAPDAKWRIQAVPVTKDSFQSRKALPEPWRGARDSGLEEITGVPGGVFVHASGFIGGNKTFEGAKAMADKACSF